jgi:two-component system, OmpR family, sensor histidine kinase MtrB
MVAMPRQRRVGLRARAVIGFGLTALLVAFALASITYIGSRRYLVDQRESTALRQAYVNARLVRTGLRSPDTDVSSFLSGLRGGTASDSLLRYRGQWFSTSVAIDSGSVPGALVAAVDEGDAAHQRYKGPQGDFALAIGVPVATADASYFEIFPLAELDRNLSLLARALVAGAVTASAVGAAIGWAFARRVVQPLVPVADAAEQIAGGALDTRLDEHADPDLRRLTHAFNTMAAALETRVEREARFAADVSHELRSPLTAVAAAIEIIERRREQLPPQVIEAFVVLREKVDRFQQMVLDLLEISRMDAGTADFAPDVVETRHFVTKLAALYEVDPTLVNVRAEAPSHFLGDRRRLSQALGNIIENARNYAGGVTGIDVLAPRPQWLRFVVEDRGPGVPSHDRAAIFGRFARGDAGHSAGASSGTGLGLALVAEHVKLHGGSVSVEENPGGGSRFVVDIPTGDTDAS